MKMYLPGDDGYDEQRAALNPDLDARPVAVVEAHGPGDVKAAVGWARRHELPLAVQATGHGTIVASDGGVLVKTSRMAGVLVDAHRRVARAGPGARWSDVIAAAAPFGLAPLSGTSPTVGVAGFTLGGGVGWLSRKFGFAADSLLRADLVTADGEPITASATRHPDLFWALRGGGGNFGVVTSLEFRLHPVARVYAGTAYFPIERAADTLARYGEWAATQPNELTTAIVLQRAPRDPRLAGPALAIRVLFVGDAADGRRALRPLWEVAGTPLVDDLAETTFAQTRIPGVAPRGFALFAALPEPVISGVVDAVADDDAPASAVEVRQWGGRMADPGPDAGPVGHRDVPFSITVDGPAGAVAPLKPHATGGSFLNFLRDPARTETAYTPRNYRRLREVKRTYDPTNVFHRNHNIAPATPPGRFAHRYTG